MHANQTELEVVRSNRNLRRREISEFIMQTLVAHLVVALVLPARPSVSITRAHAPRMDWIENLPGFWKAKVPEGYARAAHVLFLSIEDDAETKADAVLDKIRSGLLSFGAAAREYSSCPTRDQYGDLGTFASLSCMRSVDEMRSFEGTLELPYEGQNTRDFDDAIFSAPLNEPQKVQSAWGWHLILVTERGGGERAMIAPDAPVSFTAPKPPKDDAGAAL